MLYAIDETEHRARKPADQPIGAGCNSVEHWLHIVRRTSDHLKDVGRCGLPLGASRVSLNSRTFSMATPPVGEGPQQLHMMVGERTSSTRNTERQ
jgi:hypothetical protein